MTSTEFVTLAEDLFKKVYINYKREAVQMFLKRIAMPYDEVAQTYYRKGYEIGLEDASEALTGSLKKMENDFDQKVSKMENEIEKNFPDMYEEFLYEESVL